MDSNSAQPLLARPHCFGMEEHPSASLERAKPHFCSIPQAQFRILFQRLAYTVGSALGSRPPSTDSCLAAFVLPNGVGLSAGARAWSKHAHRSQPQDAAESTGSAGWWGRPFGPKDVLNERALLLFWKVMNAATWRNLHWLPHQVLVYEVRVAEGYGMRWSQDRSGIPADGDNSELVPPQWTFRGFVEPMMEGGHDVGWRH
ncbi:hypothetical protein C8R46DRAFT_1161336 [Mycena filopes]|nr:hypothetical protein C8R46DRAFT_1161336 [Mycena filopes]